MKKIFSKLCIWLSLGTLSMELPKSIQEVSAMIAVNQQIDYGLKNWARLHISESTTQLLIYYINFLANHYPNRGII